MGLNLYQILIILGVPTLISVFVLFMRDQIKGVRLGVQALLRAQLIADWNRYSEKGFAPIYAKENFENVYQQYHNLGANGVMDDIRRRFLELPDKPRKESE